MKVVQVQRTISRDWRLHRPDCQDCATCTAWVRPHCWEEQVVALETVPGPGSGGGARHQLLSGRILVAAQPTASSMETARLFSHKVPLAVHYSFPTGWPGRMCIQGLRAQRPNHRVSAGPRSVLMVPGPSPDNLSFYDLPIGP